MAATCSGGGAGGARNGSPSARTRAAGLAAAAVAITVIALALSGCASAPPPKHAPGGPVKVVAAESWWGSIAKQLGGTHVELTSLASSPDADPHDYEPTAADARAVAAADFVVFNGAGYDSWMQKMLAASPNDARLELNVAQSAGLGPGANPHIWYSPAVVMKAIDGITDAYKKADPEHASEFDRLRSEYKTKSLAQYDSIISAIASEYAGTPIGASESIALPMADALKLDVVTPPGFTSAISQGIDPKADDKAAVDKQIRDKTIAIFIYNRQNSTPDVMNLVTDAKAKGIPVVTVTETPEPVTATFQAWQVAQLQRIQGALREARKR